MSFPVIRRLSLILVLGAASVTPISAEQEDPDSVVQLSPVLVRVLGSAIQTQSPTPVSVVAGSELTRANGGAFLEEALRAVPGVQIQNSASTSQRICWQPHSGLASVRGEGRRLPTSE